MKFGIILFVVAVCIGYSLYDHDDDFNLSILRGKNVVITGASMGIGEQMAYHYAQMGARILITARSEDKLKQVIENCKQLGQPDGQYFYLVADMSDLSSTKSLIEFAELKLGGIDFLVLNHMILNNMTYWLGSQDNFKTLRDNMNVNFMAYVHLASQALPLLERSHGSMIVVSSLSGKVSQPLLISYSASKFALDGFFSGLRQELSIRDIDVTITICTLGLVDTTNVINMMTNAGMQRILSSAQRIKPEDAAYAIIKGGAAGDRNVLFPYFMVHIYKAVYNWMPALLESYSQFLYKQE